MTEYGHQELKQLIGDTVPAKGAIPAAWWITTSTEQLDAYDRWREDYAAHTEKIAALAQSLGLELTDAYVSSFHKSSTISGFRVPTFMEHWNREHPQYRPVPDGWRIDKKSDRLVPSRRTKADRESQANKDFAAIKAVPNVRAYMTGLPTEIHLDDRDFGGTMYPVNYRRGAHCVWAYSGGDPDRQAERDMNSDVDTSIWHRQKLSALIALREEAA